MDENLEERKEILKKLDIRLDSFTKKNRLKDIDILLNLVLSAAKGKITTLGIEIPVSVFNKELGSLETVVKYLKEELQFNYHQISALLNRDERTIWTTYQRSVKKKPEKLDVIKSEYTIPIVILKERRLAVLESITVYLRIRYQLTFVRIGAILKRQPPNIRTVYYRAQNKWGLRP